MARLDMVLVVVLSSLMVVALTAMYAHWRAIRTRRALRVQRLVLTGVAVQVALLLPVAFLSSLVHRRQQPADDWYDIVAFAAGALQLLLTPCVAVIVWIITSRLERLRKRSYPTACPKCGYDVSGSINSRCPECGEPSSENPEA